MANTVCYQFYNGTVAAGVQNAASALVARAGRITCITWSVAGVGAAATGLLTIEGKLNTAAGGLGGTTTINNPPRQQNLFCSTVTFPITAPPSGSSLNTIDNISIPVIVGDTINIGTGLSLGTAPTSAALWANVYVLEN